MQDPPEDPTSRSLRWIYFESVPAPESASKSAIPVSISPLKEPFKGNLGLSQELPRISVELSCSDCRPSDLTLAYLGLPKNGKERARQERAAWGMTGPSV